MVIIVAYLSGVVHIMLLSLIYAVLPSSASVVLHTASSSVWMVVSVASASAAATILCRLVLVLSAFHALLCACSLLLVHHFLDVTRQTASMLVP